MVANDKIRRRNVQNDAEAKLRELYQLLLDETIRLPSQGEDGVIDPGDVEQIARTLEEYVKVSIRETSIVKKDAEGNVIDPEVSLEGNILKINEYHIEVLPAEYLVNPEKRMNPYAIVDTEYEYMASFLAQINRVVKMNQARTRIPGLNEQALSSNLNLARMMVLQEDKVQHISKEEAYIAIGSQLSRAITKDAFVQYRANEIIKGIDGQEYGNKEFLTEDLRVQSVQNANWALEDFLEEKQAEIAYTQEDIDQVIKANPELVTKYSVLLYEYDNDGNPRSYQQVKAIIGETRRKINDENLFIEENFEELEYEISIRIVQRMYKEAIKNGFSEQEAYVNIVEEIGVEDFQTSLQEIQKYLEAGKEMESKRIIDPIFETEIADEAVNRLTPTINKNGEEKKLIPDEVFENFKNNVETVKEEHTSSIENPSIDAIEMNDEPKELFENINKVVMQILEIQQQTKEEKEPVSEVFVSVDNSQKDKSKKVEKNINIDKSKHYIDNSVYNYYINDVKDGNSGNHEKNDKVNVNNSSREKNNEENTYNDSNEINNKNNIATMEKNGNGGENDNHNNHEVNTKDDHSANNKDNKENIYNDTHEINNKDNHNSNDGKKRK